MPETRVLSVAACRHDIEGGAGPWNGLGEAAVSASRTGDARCHACRLSSSLPWLSGPAQALRNRAHRPRLQAARCSIVGALPEARARPAV